MADEMMEPDPAGSEESETATATAPVKRPANPERKPGNLPPYKVLLHNDAVSTFEHVIKSIVRLTPISEPEATLKTIEAHETGVTLLLVTHCERAELYAEQFASLSLTVTVEPD